MKPRTSHLVSLLSLVLLLAGLSACQTGCKTSLEQGGAYAPVTTNLDGTVTPTQAPDLSLALLDQTYKTVYSTVLNICNLERDNRAALWALEPGIKKSLDQIRPVIVEVDLKWARSRQAYLANPTPAGLTQLETVLAQLDRILPIVQEQLRIATEAQIASDAAKAAKKAAKAATNSVPVAP